MKKLSCEEIARPTADVGQALGLRQIRSLSPQLLSQQLLLCDVHCSAVVSLKYPIFNHRKTNTTDEPYLAIGPNYSAGDIALAALLVHRLYGLRQARSVLGMDRREKLLKFRSSVFRIKSENVVDFVRPIDI